MARRSTQIAAAVVGNALEWYDFVVYGFLTVIISRLFFPAESRYASLLLTMAAFGVGFFMRPVGGVALGLYADRAGRKAALQLIIALMTLSLGILALAPPYAAIGIAAPLLVVLARLLQGFATGGEFASATAFLVEIAPAHRRALYGSLQMVGQSLAALVGALAGALITRALSPEQLDSFGWRLPFAFGLLIGPVGLYIRRHLDETEEFERSRLHPERPRLGALADHGRGLAVTFGLVVCGTISYYVVLVYMPTFASTELGLSLGDAFASQVIGLALMTAVIPLAGALADRIGCRPVLIGATAAYFLALLPSFAWLHGAPSAFRLALVQSALCGVLGVYWGAFSTAVADEFPTRVRSTGLAVAYNTAVMAFGGFAQVIVTWLIHATESPLAPAFYLMFGAATGFVAALYSGSSPPSAQTVSNSSVATGRPNR